MAHRHTDASLQRSLPAETFRHKIALEGVIVEWPTGGGRKYATLVCEPRGLWLLPLTGTAALRAGYASSEPVGSSQEMMEGGNDPMEEQEAVAQSPADVTSSSRASGAVRAIAFRDVKQVRFFSGGIDILGPDFAPFVSAIVVTLRRKRSALRATTPAHPTSNSAAPESSAQQEVKEELTVYSYQPGSELPWIVAASWRNMHIRRLLGMSVGDNSKPLDGGMRKDSPRGAAIRMVEAVCDRVLHACVEVDALVEVAHDAVRARAPAVRSPSPEARNADVDALHLHVAGYDAEAEQVFNAVAVLRKGALELESAAERAVEDRHFRADLVSSPVAHALIVHACAISTLYHKTMRFLAIFSSDSPFAPRALHTSQQRRLLRTVPHFQLARLRYLLAASKAIHAMVFDSEGFPSRLRVGQPMFVHVQHWVHCMLLDPEAALQATESQPARARVANDTGVTSAKVLQDMIDVDPLMSHMPHSQLMIEAVRRSYHALTPQPPKDHARLADSATLSPAGWRVVMDSRTATATRDRHRQASRSPVLTARSGFAPSASKPPLHVPRLDLAGAKSTPHSKPSKPQHSARQDDTSWYDEMGVERVDDVDDLSSRGGGSDSDRRSVGSRRGSTEGASARLTVRAEEGSDAMMYNVDEMDVQHRFLAAQLREVNAAILLELDGVLGEASRARAWHTMEPSKKVKRHAAPLRDMTALLSSSSVADTPAGDVLMRTLGAPKALDAPRSLGFLVSTLPDDFVITFSNRVISELTQMLLLALAAKRSWDRRVASRVHRLVLMRHALHAAGASPHVPAAARSTEPSTLGAHGGAQRPTVLVPDEVSRWPPSSSTPGDRFAAVAQTLIDRGGITPAGGEAPTSVVPPRVSSAVAALASRVISPKSVDAIALELSAGGYQDGYQSTSNRPSPSASPIKQRVGQSPEPRTSGSTSAALERPFSLYAMRLPTVGTPSLARMVAEAIDDGPEGGAAGIADPEDAAVMSPFRSMKSFLAPDTFPAADADDPCDDTTEYRNPAFAVRLLVYARLLRALAMDSNAVQRQLAGPAAARLRAILELPGVDQGHVFHMQEPVFVEARQELQTILESMKL